jgi:hypothetical protein
MGECIAALEREVNRLREKLRHGLHTVPAVSRSATDGRNPEATSPRLTLSR